MKYCLNYNKDTEKSKCIQKVDEWIIDYNSKDNTLLDFLEKYKDKRINIYINEDNINFKFLTELCEKYNNVYIKFNGDKYLEIVKQNKPNFKFFFDIMVNNWDVLIGLFKMGVTDIYIVEDLAFELDKVHKIATEYGVQIRIYPNIAQSRWSDSSQIKKFFIRPEDIDAYEEYINVVEFYNVDKKIDIYYNIYKEKQKWFGQLNEIILDFNSNIDNRYIIPRFAEMRIKCDKNCLKGGNCRRCEIIEKLSNNLEETKLVVSIDKNKTEGEL